MILNKKKIIPLINELVVSDLMILFSFFIINYALKDLVALLTLSI